MLFLGWGRRAAPPAREEGAAPGMARGLLGENGRETGKNREKRGKESGEGEKKQREKRENDEKGKKKG